MIEVLTREKVEGLGIESIVADDVVSLSGLRDALLQLSETTEIVGVVSKPISIRISDGTTVLVEREFADNADAVMLAMSYVEDRGDGEMYFPLIVPCEGSVRDDFDLGHIVFYRRCWLQHIVDTMVAEGEAWRYSALYDVYLRALEQVSRGSIVIKNDVPYYRASALDLRASGERQFDYVDPRNREVQIEREKVCTAYLKRVGALVDYSTLQSVDISEGDYPCEMSVIIPVYNRVRTVGEAVRSALSQKTDFAYNVMVVDNHSSDGTTELLAGMAADDNRLVHLIPSSYDLLIGGCWNYAVAHERCGRFAVQLDSDDLYEGVDVLTKIYTLFQEQRCAMAVGSYTIVNENLEPIPPGLIDHKEWTPENGMNNALRINGLGAPRAFFTGLLRRYPLPNVSYGEDYAAGLKFSGQYKIGRIYESLYLCRRWSGNSDAALTPERVNSNNAYKDMLRMLTIRARRERNKIDVKAFIERQLSVWPEAKERYDALSQVKKRCMDVNGVKVEVRFNPSRIRSTGAKIDAQSVAQRPCFLCSSNRPKEQIAARWHNYDILVNPYPIFRQHLTIVSCQHEEQDIDAAEMISLAQYLEGMAVFYNGAQCGASAPDHKHYQASNADEWPLLAEWDLSVMKGRVHKIAGTEKKQMSEAFDDLVKSRGYDKEMMNVVCICRNGAVEMYVIPRKAFRPWQYTAEDERQLMVSPASAEMGGVIVTPVEEHFSKITSDDIADIYSQVYQDIKE